MSRLYAWALAALGVIAALYAAMLRGKSAAKTEQTEEVLDNVKKAKEATDQSASLSDRAKRDELRERIDE